MSALVTAESLIADDALSMQGLAGDSAGAIETGRKALAINNLDATAHYNLGCSLETVGDTEGALDQYNQALELNCLDADALQRRGQLNLGAGRVELAVSDLRNAARIRPKLVSVQNDLGVALFELGDSDGALKAFQRALELDPSDEQALDNVSAVRKFLGA